MNRKSIRLGLVVLACLIPSEYARSQDAADPWYGRQAKPKNIDPPKTFLGSFAIELPKGWQLAPGHTGTIFSMVEKTKRFEPGALITLEYMRLQAPLDPALIAGASERELREVQSRELSGKGFTSEVKKGPPGQFVFIRYHRPGLAGSDDLVLQYSIPIGTTMYRLVCIAPATDIDKYRSTFAHVAASFTVLKPSGI